MFADMLRKGAKKQISKYFDFSPKENAPRKKISDIFDLIEHLEFRF